MQPLIPADVDALVQAATGRLAERMRELTGATAAWAAAQHAADARLLELMRAHAAITEAVVALRSAQSARVAAIETALATASVAGPQA